MNPKVSVIMTVYNGALYITETLEALKNQTYSNYELIINDNNSTDGTAKILDKYAAQDKRIKIISVSSEKGTASFTEGIARAFKASTAELVAVNDADDISSIDRLERQVRLFEMHPDINLVASWFEHIDMNGHHIRINKVPSSIIDAYQSGNPIAHSSIMYRRSAAEIVGGYKEKFTYASDFSLQVALVAAGGGIAVIDEPLVKIRLHGNQTSHILSGSAQFYLEQLQILSVSCQLKGASWQAKYRGMISRQKLSIRYGFAEIRENNLFSGIIGSIYWFFVSTNSLIPYKFYRTNKNN